MRRLQHYGMMVAAAALLAASGTVAQAADPDLQSLQQQINMLQQQLKDLQAKQAAQPVAAAPAEQPVKPIPAGTSAPGSFLGAFTIPGTKTQFKVGGYARLDVTYDVDAGLGGAGAQSYGIKPVALTSANNAGFALPGTAADRQRGRFQESARNSRIIMETRTPTELGEVKFFVETDWQGGNFTGNQSSSNSTELRLRQAYGTIGNLTVGQTWTLMEDRATIPNSLDLNAPFGIENGLRIPTAQYRFDLDSQQQNQLSIGIENPYNDWSGADKEYYNTAGTWDPTNNVTKAPDITAKYAYNAAWGRLTLAAVGRYLESNSAGTSYTNSNGKVFAGGIHADTLGWGFSTGGKVKVPVFDPKDAVTFRLTAGQGIGRYLQGISPASAYVDNAGNLKTPAVGGVTVSYQKWFGDRWQANAIYGKEHVYYQNTLISAANQAGLQKNVEELELNLQWIANPYVTLGAAYYYADTEVERPFTGMTAAQGATRSTSGTTAHDNRFQFTTVIGF